MPIWPMHHDYDPHKYGMPEYHLPHIGLRKIKSVLAVNAPLMINLHKTKAGIKNFEGDMIHMIYGEKDPSYPYVEILRSSISPKFSYSTVKNADHKFTNMLEEFISLPERFLFDIQSGKREE